MATTKLYRERRNAGLCVNCEKPVDKYAMCDACRNARNAQRRSRQEEYKKIGICRCGKKLYGDEKTCLSCRTSSYVYHSNKRRNMTDEERDEYRKKDCEYQKKKQRENIKNGICVRCYKPNNNGKIRCDRCNAIFNEYQKKRKERLGLYAESRESKIARGACLYCGNPVYENFKLCKECYAKACTNINNFNQNHFWRELNYANICRSKNYCM